MGVGSKRLGNSVDTWNKDSIHSHACFSGVITSKRLVVPPAQEKFFLALTRVQRYDRIRRKTTHDGRERNNRAL
jgi:hypothetical protein